jgi:hypothetical protein
MGYIFEYMSTTIIEAYKQLDHATQEEINFIDELTLLQEKFRTYFIRCFQSELWFDKDRKYKYPVK